MYGKTKKSSTLLLVRLVGDFLVNYPPPKGSGFYAQFYKKNKKTKISVILLVKILLTKYPYNLQ